MGDISKGVANTLYPHPPQKKFIYTVYKEIYSVQSARGKSDQFISVFTKSNPSLTEIFFVALKKIADQCSLPRNFQASRVQERLAG
jgi:hypothetical protein